MIFVFYFRKHYYQKLLHQDLKLCPFQQNKLKLKIMTSNLLKSIVKIFPPLSTKNTKGESGRIGVVGGSYQFTGAPFYSAISALKVGGDLGHIFCNKTSAAAIKTYSPEIIIHPIFVSDEELCLLSQGKQNVPQLWLKKIIGWSRAINIWIVGPGLGRDPNMAQFFPTLVKNLPSEDILVFNADGIYHLCQHPQLFEELPRFKKSVLLTNHRQWDVLKQYLKIDISWTEWEQFQTKQNITQITSYVSNPDFTLILKGRRDIIVGKRSFICDIEGGRKRCGGIGDILAGITGVCTYWDQQLGPILASQITKQATRSAFQKLGRSLTPLSVISQLPRTVMEIQKRFK